jgi:hypothetical protein
MVRIRSGIPDELSSDSGLIINGSRRDTDIDIRELTTNFHTPMTWITEFGHEERVSKPPR